MQHLQKSKQALVQVKGFKGSPCFGHVVEYLQERIKELKDEFVYVESEREMVIIQAKIRALKDFLDGLLDERIFLDKRNSQYFT